mmetsp:Transcript_258/g.908  ORF Transcript_258/g.908 Transcript_258/m.908 type:complete len:183 (-) Transcript_258:396-944(-)
MEALALFWRPSERTSGLSSIVGGSCSVWERQSVGCSGGPSGTVGRPLASSTSSAPSEMRSSCLPASTTQPWSTTTILSLSLTVLRRWAMTSAEPWRASLSRDSCTSFSVSLSRPLVASSSRMTSGFRTMARAMARRWRWPPDRFLPPSRIIDISLSGFSLTKSHAFASLHAWTTSSSVTSTP